MLKGAPGGKRAARQRRHAMQSLRTQKPRDAGQGDVPWAVASGLSLSLGQLRLRLSSFSGGTSDRDKV
jgi:hypothetical protein